MIRALILAGGVAGAAGLSQFPEYSQQYNQRLAGAVDELSHVVADFDASAAAEGLSREAALAQMVGLQRQVKRRLSRITQPLLVMQGRLDTSLDIHGAEEVIAQHKSVGVDGE